MEALYDRERRGTTVMKAMLRVMLALWLKTADGFVSLRQGPSARHPEVARMKPQELVGLLHPDRDDIVRSGDWLFVRWYPGTRRTADHIPAADAAKARTGWVRDKLLDCFEE